MGSFSWRNYGTGGLIFPLLRSRFSSVMAIYNIEAADFLRLFYLPRRCKRPGKKIEE